MNQNPIAIASAGTAFCRANEDNVVNMTKALLDYEEQNKILKEELARMQSQEKITGPHEKDLDEFNKCALAAQEELYLVQEDFYLNMK